MPTVPGQTTLLALRTAVRQRADQVNSQFVTDAELTGYINASAYELYDLLIQHYGDDYFVASPAGYTTDGVNDKYLMPFDFYKLLGVDVYTEANRWQNVPKFNFAERNMRNAYNGVTQSTTAGWQLLRYRLQGSNLWLTPLPAAGLQLQVWYVPRDTLLVGDQDVFDGISGWEEYVIVDAAIKCLQKEESDPSVFMAQKQGLIQRIEAAAENRDAANPSTVVDSRAANAGIEYLPGMGPYWDGF